MLLQCVSEELTASQCDALGSYVREGQRFPVKKGEMYVALGLSFWSDLAWVEIAENERTVAPVPLFLFDVVNPAVSATWEVQPGEEGSVTIWPALFYVRDFHDRLSNGDPELVDRFRQLRLELESEARSAVERPEGRGHDGAAAELRGGR